MNVDTDIESIDSLSDTDDQYVLDDRVWTVRLIQRYIRDWQNPFEFYNEEEFKKRYRFNKDSVLHGILLKIEGLAKINKRGLPIVPHF